MIPGAALRCLLCGRDPFRRVAAGGYRVDIDGGADDDPPGREPIVGPPGVLLGALLCCGVDGGVVGLGAEVGCGLPLLDVGAGLAGDFVVGAVEAAASLIDPACRPDPCADEPDSGGTAEDWESGDPPGNGPALPTVVDEEPLPPFSCPAG
ncbi:MAG: hypothetical protein HOV87_13585 [Catenulispora sp.]|nr:hypothetical protein [Catenulispora sp.]